MELLFFYVFFLISNKKEIEFYKKYMEDEKQKIADLEAEIRELKNAKPNTRTKVFDEIFKKRDM